MRNTFKTVFYVNVSKEKNGIVPIMGRVTINGTIAQFSCKQRIPKDLWDTKGNRAKGKSREAVAVNYALNNIKAQITTTSGFPTVRRLSRLKWYATPIRASVRSMKLYCEPLTRRRGVCQTGWQRPLQAHVPEVSDRPQIRCGVHQTTIQADGHGDERTNGGLHP